MTSWGECGATRRLKRRKRRARTPSWRHRLPHATVLVNIVQRWRREGPRSLQRVLEQTGGAVALCSATTIIGYGSLLVADNRALRGFGLLASLAELACIGAALVALPAWLSRQDAQQRAHSAKRKDAHHRRRRP
jgi:hypothetical protein